MVPKMDAFNGASDPFVECEIHNILKPLFICSYLLFRNSPMPASIEL